MSGLTTEQSGVIVLVLLVVLVVVLVIDAGLFIAWAIRKDAVEAGLAPPLFAPRWSLVHIWISAHILVLVMLAFAVTMTLILGLFVVLGSKGRPLSVEQQMTALMLPVTLLSLIPQNFLMVALPVWFITRRYDLPLSAIGFHLRPTRREVLLGLALGLGIMALGMAMEVTLSVLGIALLGPARFHALEQTNKLIGNETFIMESMRSPIAFVLLLVTGGLLAPIGEEFFFRGFLYNAAKHRLGLAWGVALSAILFALVHAGPLSILGILPIGIALALAYERTRSLWIPILMHITNNSLQLIGYFIYQMFRSAMPHG